MDGSPENVLGVKAASLTCREEGICTTFFTRFCVYFTLFEKQRERDLGDWFTPFMLTARADPGRSQGLHLGIIQEGQGSRHSNHQSLLVQSVCDEEAGPRAKLGLEAGHPDRGVSVPKGVLTKCPLPCC